MVLQCFYGNYYCLVQIYFIEAVLLYIILARMLWKLSDMKGIRLLQLFFRNIECVKKDINFTFRTTQVALYGRVNTTSISHTLNQLQ